jgi:hypothetical protein
VRFCAPRAGNRSVAARAWQCRRASQGPPSEVLETGQALEIERNGKTLVIAPKEEPSIWDRLPRREGAIIGDPDELIHIDWSSEWNPDPH